MAYHDTEAAERTSESPARTYVHRLEMSEEKYGELNPHSRRLIMMIHQSRPFKGVTGSVLTRRSLHHEAKPVQKPVSPVMAVVSCRGGVIKKK